LIAKPGRQTVSVFQYAPKRNWHSVALATIDQTGRVLQKTKNQVAAARRATDQLDAARNQSPRGNAQMTGVSVRGRSIAMRAPGGAHERF
jgi:hypothetical protein